MKSHIFGAVRVMGAVPAVWLIAGIIDLRLMQTTIAYTPLVLITYGVGGLLIERRRRKRRARS